MAPLSRRKEMDCPDTKITTQAYLLETAVVGPIEHRPHQLPMTRPSRLEGDLGLMPSCLEGHQNSQWPIVPLAGTMGTIGMVCEGLDRPKPDYPPHRPGSSWALPA